ncbi:MAG TPA: P-II family nitrogen regulator [Dehalococcoidia bacterium]|nr:P-II family nitrogen regulator [Dehalococcoidia bacterium]
MKMIQAVIRPDREEAVAAALARASFPALTKWDVTGRGKQRGIQVGSQLYDELAKCMIMVVVKDEDAENAVSVIREAAFSGYTGDGKVFISAIEDAVTIRTGKSEL